MEKKEEMLFYVLIDCLIGKFFYYGDEHSFTHFDWCSWLRFLNVIKKNTRNANLDNIIGMIVFYYLSTQFK